MQCAHVIHYICTKKDLGHKDVDPQVSRTDKSEV